MYQPGWSGDLNRSVDQEADEMRDNPWGIFWALMWIVEMPKGFIIGGISILFFILWFAADRWVAVFHGISVWSVSPVFSKWDYNLTKAVLFSPALLPLLLGLFVKRKGESSETVLKWAIGITTLTWVVSPWWWVMPIVAFLFVFFLWRRIGQAAVLTIGLFLFFLAAAGTYSAVVAGQAIRNGCRQHGLEACVEVAKDQREQHQDGGSATSGTPGAEGSGTGSEGGYMSTFTVNDAGTLTALPTLTATISPQEAMATVTAAMDQYNQVHGPTQTAYAEQFLSKPTRTPELVLTLIPRSP